jgi:hypothetical protein
VQSRDHPQATVEQSRDHCQATQPSRPADLSHCASSDVSLPIVALTLTLNHRRVRAPAQSGLGPAQGCSGQDHPTGYLPQPFQRDCSCTPNLKPNPRSCLARLQAKSAWGLFEQTRVSRCATPPSRCCTTFSKSTVLMNVPMFGAEF